MLDTGNLVMNCDCHRYHSLFQTYRMFVPQEFNPTLMVHLIKGLEHLLRRKVAKSKPTSMDDAISRVWKIFHSEIPMVRARLRPWYSLPHRLSSIRWRSFHHHHRPWSWTRCGTPLWAPKVH